MTKTKLLILLKLAVGQSDCSTREAPTTTRSGYTCQRWDATTPHQPKFKPGYAKHNRCANPDGAPGSAPWCYTTDRTKRWDYCDVEQCDCEWNCIVGNGATYNGTLSTTVSGRTCQQWDSRTPHTPKYRPAWTNHNYCRNPNGISGAGPWCYTNDPDKRWEACFVPECKNGQNPCFNNVPTTKTTTTTVKPTTKPKRAPRPTLSGTAKCGINFARFKLNDRYAEVSKHNIEGAYFIDGEVQKTSYFPATKWSTVKQRLDKFEIVGGSKTSKGSLPHQVALRKNKPPLNR